MSNALTHLLHDWRSFPDETMVQLLEYVGDEVVADDETFTPGQDAEKAATLGQLRALERQIGNPGKVP